MKHYKISKGNNEKTGICSLSTLSGYAVEHYAAPRGSDKIAGTCPRSCPLAGRECYARNLSRYPNVYKVYKDNTLLIKGHAFEQLKNDVLDYVKNNRISAFRWHDSGDIISAEHLAVLIDIANAAPRVSFYTYTHNIKLANDFIKAGNKLPDNLIVNISTDATAWPIWDAIKDKYMSAGFGFFIYNNLPANVDDITVCPAVDERGKKTGVKCASCGRCLDDVNVTTVWPH